MLKWALVFAMVCAIAGPLGVRGLAAGAAGIGALRNRDPPSLQQRRLKPGAALLSALIAFGLAACASAPALPDASALKPAPATAPSAAQVAQQLSVVAAGGPLDHGERAQVLRSVAQQGSADALKRQLAAMASFGDVDLYAGNETKLLIDGPATFEAMFGAIAKARHTILLESYIIEDAAISRRLVELLAEKRRQGVQVFMIYDALGSISTEDSFFEALRRIGVAICAFNPLNPIQRPGYFNISHRDHRKILSVDREVGFTGGINISAVYATGSLGRKRGSAAARTQPDQESWRDTQIQLRGPAVLALDELFRQTWRQQGCEGALPAPPDSGAGRTAGQQLMRIIPSTPDDAVNRIYALLLTSIGAAERSVYLTMAYFAPGPEMIEVLCAAAARGVDVQLLLPSRSDFMPVLHAGRSHYQRLLEAGVKIHELQEAVLHAKTAVIDGVVSTVGSSNMDWRSFTANNEVNAVVIGDDFGAAMTRMFRQDRNASQPITPEAWGERPLWQRIKELLARLFERWW